MTTSEQVTKFKLSTDWYETPMGTFDRRADADARCRSCDFDPDLCVTHRVETPLVSDLIRAINQHLKEREVNPEEYDFCVSTGISYDAPDTHVPEKYRYLIAYAIEGGSEGYYVHAGALLRDDIYLDFGFCKTYSPDSAYAIATEVQRFLTAAQWN